MYLPMCIYIYTYVYVYVNIFVYIYIFIYLCMHFSLFIDIEAYVCYRTNIV